MTTTTGQRCNNCGNEGSNGSFYDLEHDCFYCRECGNGILEVIEYKEPIDYGYCRYCGRSADLLEGDTPLCEECYRDEY